MNWNIKLYHNQKVVQQIELCCNPCVVGRSSNANIVLTDPQVSRQHCSLIQKGSQLWVEDLKSCNGTLINGMLAIQMTELHRSDVVRIGPYLLFFWNENPVECYEESPTQVIETQNESVSTVVSRFLEPSVPKQTHLDMSR